MFKQNTRAQALYLSFEISLTLFLGIRISSSCFPERERVCPHHDFDGYVVSSLYRLWSRTGREMLMHCAADCYREQRCQAFFYNNLTLVCQGHSNSSLSIVDAIPEDGWVHYRYCLLADCTKVPNTGIYNVTPYDGLDSVQVFCDMETDGGGWLVFQRRTDGSVDFDRVWEDYKAGFGFLDNEFWLGNDYIHRLTSQRSYTLRIDLADFENGTCSSNYTEFNVASKDELYKITVGGYAGECGDSLSYASGSNFSTFDRDNDKYPGNCAERFSGGWWFSSCHLSLLTGEYNSTVYATGVGWRTWKGRYYSLKFTEMKFRPSLTFQ